MRTTRSLFVGALLAMTLTAGGCADGGTSRSRDSGPSGTLDGGETETDAGPLDSGPAPVDSGSRDGGPDASGADAAVDAGPGAGLECTVCETTSDCAAGSHCVLLGRDQRVCLRECVVDLPECARGFECVETLLTTDLPAPVCVPVGERCCVDGDGDHYGQGVGCDGSDCDDTDPDVHPGAAERCNGIDDDCSGTADDGDASSICPRGDHVAAAMCIEGACTVAMCEPDFADCDGANEDCETSLRTVTDCGGCGVACVLPNATATCASGACAIATCNPGYGDCDGNPANGCETALNTLSACGACGVTCGAPNAITSCATGVCEITGCGPTWGNCDSLAVNGCETSITSNANCGACGATCAPANGAGDCSTGSCRVTSCLPGWSDCDGNVANGCETNIRTLTDCGACGVMCGGANASASCSTGSCSLTCTAGFRDCDGNMGNGCETNINSSLAHCGGCGMVCDRANAAESCSAGVCTLGACTSGYDNCDGNAVNGCELDHRAGSCGSAIDLGTYDGDRSCGFVCGGNTEWDLFASRAGNTSQWFRATIFEDSSCDADVEHQIRLQSPAGLDYDLFVYSACGGTLLGSSQAGAGALDTVTIRRADNTSGNDGITYWIEVRYYSGAGCGNWTLNAYGHDC